MPKSVSEVAQFEPGVPMSVSHFELDEPKSLSQVAKFEPDVPKSLFIQETAHQICRSSKQMCHSEFRM